MRNHEESARPVMRRARRRGGRARRCLATAALLLTTTAPAVLAAQSAHPGATPFLPRAHWALEAARRLETLGLLGAEFDTGSATVTLGRMATLFARAEARAEGDDPEILALTRAYRARFAEEFGGVRDAATAESIRHLGGALRGGWERHTGRALAGVGYFPDDWTGARPDGDDTQGGVAVRANVALGRHVAVSVAPFAGQDVRLEAGHLLVGAAGVAVWAGRRALGYGAGQGGGLVLDGPVTLDAAGLATTEPFRLPWVLRHLGPVQLDLTMSRLERNGSFDDPWLLGMRARIAPHPRLSLGINRGSMLGGAGNAEVPFDEVLQGVVGLRPGDSRFDNQIVSLDIRYRPPLAGLPLAAYVEFGAEDSSGAWWDVPGVVAGVEVGALPGARTVAVGVELASFAESCCGNPAWYRHWNFREGWTDRGRLLAHPLGGNGHQILAFARLDGLSARLRMRGAFFLRERRAENVQAPERQGGSVGFTLDATLRLEPGFDLFAGAHVENGERDWRRTSLSGGLRWLF